MTRQQTVPPLSLSSAVGYFALPFVGLAALSSGLGRASACRRNNAALRSTETADGSTAALGAVPGDDDGGVCSICLSERAWPCVTQCGHQFCTACLIEYWQSRAEAAPINCPNCRAPVRLLVPAYPPETAETSAPQRARLRDLDGYNSAHGTEAAASWSEALRTAPFFLRLTLRSLAHRPGLTLRALFLAAIRMRRLAVLLGGLAYVASPFDFLPEVRVRNVYSLKLNYALPF